MATADDLAALAALSPDQQQQLRQMNGQYQFGQSGSFNPYTTPQAPQAQQSLDPIASWKSATNGGNYDAYNSLLATNSAATQALKAQGLTPGTPEWNAAMQQQQQYNSAQMISQGKRSAYIDPNGQVTMAQYDQFGRPLAQAAGNGPQQAASNIGTMTQYTDPTQSYLLGDPNAARNAFSSLQTQGALAQGRQAPMINTSAVNMINGGAGNSLGQANATNLMTDASAIGLANTANGPQAQGQMSTAGALQSAANGAAVQGGMAAGQGLLSAANGAAAQGQLNSANALMNASNGPALGAQFNTAGQIGALANGSGVQGQYNFGNQLAQGANGQNAQAQLNLANQIAAVGNRAPGPSVAELQLQQGADKSMAQQMAMASSARGGNAALALQNAGQNQGAAMGDLNRSEALLRAQEDMANRQFQAGTLGQAAGITAGVQGQANQALMGAANAYGNAAGQQGSLLNMSGSQYGQTAGTQANILGMANQGYGGAVSGQIGALNGAGNQFTNAGQLQGSLLSNANQGYNAALAGQQGAYAGAGQLTQGVANNQLGQAGTQANIANTYADLAQAQMQGQLTQGAQNDQFTLQSQGLGFNVADAERQALMQGSENNIQANIDAYNAAKQLQQRQKENSDNWTHSLIAGGLTAAGAVGGTLIGGPAGGVAGAAGGNAIANSDIRAKKDIKSAGQDVSNAIRSVSTQYPTLSSEAGLETQNPYMSRSQAYGMAPNPYISQNSAAFPDAPGYSYKYKDPSAVGSSPGVHFGPMAQDLEKTPAGASVVVNKPDGTKAIDTGRLSLLNTSELSKMRQELDQLKGQGATIRNTNVMYPMGGKDNFHAVAPVGNGVRPFAPGEYVDNPDGSWSNERTVTVTDPRLNKGKPTVIPSVWLRNGSPYEAKDPAEAAALAGQSGYSFPGFGDMKAAEDFANQRESNWQNIQPGDRSVAPLYTAPPKPTPAYAFGA